MDKNKQKHLSASLKDFYSKPVAVVSMELILSIILVIVLGVFAIQPTLVTMSELIKEIDDKKDLNGKLATKISQLQSAQNEYYRVENSLYLIDEAIPSQPELIKVLKIVELLATENNVLINSVGVPNIPDEKISQLSFAEISQQPLAISVSVAGDYVDIRAYIEALRKSRRIFEVATVTFNVSENRGDQTLQASISLNAPYFGSNL